MRLSIIRSLMSSKPQARPSRYRMIKSQYSWDACVILVSLFTESKVHLAQRVQRQSYQLKYLANSVSGMSTFGPFPSGSTNSILLPASFLPKRQRTSIHWWLLILNRRSLPLVARANSQWRIYMVESLGLLTTVIGILKLLKELQRFASWPSII